MVTIPTISAVIPAYNRRHFIRRAVESVLLQSLPVSEILVVDDGSTDDLWDILTEFWDRIRLIKHAKNRGAAAARNTGTQEAAGEFVAFLDSDDTWKPEKLHRQLAFMEQRQLDLSCTGFEIVEAGETFARSAWRPYPETLRLDHFVWGCFVAPGSTFVARRSLLNSYGGYDTRFARFEDWDLFLRLAEANPKGIGFLQEPLATIHFGQKPQTDKVFASLDKLLETHVEGLSAQNRQLARNFRSGVAFHRASAYAATRNWSAMTNELARCIFHAPRGNWPLRVILGGMVQGKFRFAHQARHVAK